MPPAIAAWIAATYQVVAFAVRDRRFRDAADLAIFQAARAGDAVVMTKDRDFVDLVRRHGSPPQVIWVTCGNTSNARLREILTVTLPAALRLLEDGEPVVEIRAR